MSNAAGGKIIVVGTGIVGLTTAWELLRRGFSVAIVGPRGRKRKGQATLAAGGMLSVFSEIEAKHTAERIAVETSERVLAHRLWYSLMGQLSEAAGRQLELVQGTWVIGSVAEHAVLGTIAATARQHGHPAEHHMAPIVPGLRPSVAVASALWLPTEYSLDVSVLMDILTDVIDSHPDSDWQHEWATCLTVDQSGNPAIVCDDIRIVADRIVLAAGVGIPKLLAGSGLEVNVPTILAGRGTGLVLRATHSVRCTIRTPNRDFSCGTHMVPLYAGLTYLGATNRFQSESASVTDATLDEVMTLIHDATTGFDSRLEDAQLVEVRVGHRPYTLDRLPVVGPAPDARILLATATYRSGVLLAPRVAQLVADEIAEPGCHSEHPYRPDRPPTPVDLDSLLGAGARELVDVICGPGGHIAPWSVDRLAAFIKLTLKSILTGTVDDPAAETVRQLWLRAPVAEVIPMIHRLVEQEADLAARSGPISSPIELQ